MHLSRSRALAPFQRRKSGFSEKNAWPKISNPNCSSHAHRAAARHCIQRVPRLVPSQCGRVLRYFGLVSVLQIFSRPPSPSLPPSAALLRACSPPRSPLPSLATTTQPTPFKTPPDFYRRVEAEQGHKRSDAVVRLGKEWCCRIRAIGLVVADFKEHADSTEESIPYLVREACQPHPRVSGAVPGHHRTMVLRCIGRDESGD